MMLPEASDRRMIQVGWFLSLGTENPMTSQQVVQFHECFAYVDDPRMRGKCDHPLHSLLFLITSAVIAGADGPTEIEEFGIEKEDWLAEFVDFPEGIPSHDTIGRLLGLINPDDFQVVFLDWISQIQVTPMEDGPIHVEIDGKTSRGSYTDAGKTDAIHVVSAWASEAGVTLGQRCVDSKSNEITAIPQVLEMIDLTNAIVILDALGCQKSIAKKIVDEGGDYTLALKDNHPKFCEAKESFFEKAHDVGLSESNVRSSKTVQEKRGRVEERYYAVTSIPAEMKAMASQWANLKSIGQAITISESPSGTTTEMRYYLSSRSPRGRKPTENGLRCRESELPEKVHHYTFEEGHFTRKLERQTKKSGMEHNDSSKSSCSPHDFMRWPCGSPCRSLAMTRLRFRRTSRRLGNR